jgi:hypothetical protein
VNSKLSEALLARFRRSLIRINPESKNPGDEISGIFNGVMTPGSDYQ